jgi:hypothetical protein
MDGSRRSARSAGRPIKVVASLVVAGGIALVPTAADASTLPTSAPATSSGSTAVVTPLLNLFAFGDSVGLPEVCQTGLATLSAVVAESNASGQFDPLANEIGLECQNFANEGSIYVQDGVAASGQLSFLNPVFDPLVTDGSTALGTLGTAYGAQLSPFGPTIAGLGQTVSFFESSN